MKKTVTLLAVITTSILFGQASSKLNNAQNVTVSVATPISLIGAEPLPLGTWIKYDFASIRFGTSQVTGLDTYIQSLAYPLTGNPSGFLTSVPAQSWSSIIGKPTFNSVATSGDYNDLINKPAIPSGQVSSDWNSISGVSQILNKPTTLSAFTNDLGFVSGSSLSTTLSNYATTSALNTALSNYTTSVNLATALAGKENTITAGTTLQYWRGDKTWAALNTTNVPEGTNLYFTNTRSRSSVSAGAGISYNATTGIITNSSPDQVVSISGAGGTTVTGTYPNFTVSTSSGKRQVTATGTTDASGNYTFTFSPAFSTTPNVQASIANQGANTNQFIKVVSATTTSVTVNVFQRSAVTLLSVEVLLAATTNVSGATVDLLITEK